jgi:hypothetical protein
MPRPRAMVPPEAIRIEDEVWQEAFARREPGDRRSPPRLRAIDGGRAGEGRHVVEGPRPIERPAPATAAAQPASAAPPVRALASTAQPVTHQAGTAVPGRRTVTIQGRGAERNLPWPDASRRRPQRRMHERAGFRPDRVAMWAVMLGILLVLIAVLSAHS